ncbi:elongation of very long chain fatty acids protein 4-like [Haliotis rufescens]|uniref:elongation of very long chain fatty acids protein 4-like n=1 Tax=Haliotis rufescens TaxID=6454 RepID=UPI001EB09453|nr:elongation of very long chain fatty acids protein 4-like [Haliotis rufescens]XP_046353444.1 elongation of very long chain fatty acids protein 4-like [Haliotis rufescens]XP_046353445.1 elongation of very long chain fatty acids protein 4-like [Haliotis rufescens]XP_046353446.1 elongation of very long chain fatty acids protein 4-like [Haliotis rufescens]
MGSVWQNMTGYYQDSLDRGDPRVSGWLLMDSPVPSVVIFLLYLLVVWLGPRIMAGRKPVNLKLVLIPYNFGLVALSCYMFCEFVVTSTLSHYSFLCQPVDYSDSPLALRMAQVCWWFFFSKIIELLDTVFFILRKKNDQVTFLHVYHHCTMIANWWLGVKYVAGGQSFFVAMLNSGVHIAMYLYYALSCLGPHMQKYLWWKKYLTRLQLTQFLAFVVHTGYNLMTDCDFPRGFNIAVFLYALSLILLFGNFYYRAYTLRQREAKKKQ